MIYETVQIRRILIITKATSTMIQLPISEKLSFAIFPKIISMISEYLVTKKVTIYSVRTVGKVIND